MGFLKKRHFVVLLFFFQCSCVTTPGTREKSEEANTTECWDHINFEKTEKTLLSGTIKKKIPFYEYYKKQKVLKGIPEEKIEKRTFFKERKKRHHNESHLFVLFYHNGIKAIFKEKPRFSIRKTIFAYKISRFLDLKIVPPTVPRKIDGEEGVVQLFVESNRAKRAYVENLSSIEKGHLYLFIFLTGLVDTNHDNLLISKRCLKPVFVDLDTTRIIRAEFGENPPFERVAIEWPLLDEKSFTKLYLQKPIKSKIPPFENLKRVFPGLKEDKILYLKKTFQRADKNTISYFKYKQAWWIKYSKKNRIIRYLLPLSGESLPAKTLRKLKKLNKKSIKELLKPYKMDQSVINGIFFRRNLILKTIEKRKIQ